MKTFKIYTAEGKFVSKVMGDNLSSGTTWIAVHASGEVVAILPITGFAIVLVQDSENA